MARGEEEQYQHGYHLDQYFVDEQIAPLRRNGTFEAQQRRVGQIIEKKKQGAEGSLTLQVVRDLEMMLGSGLGVDA